MTGLTSRRGYVLFLLVLVYTLSVLDRYILGVLLPAIKADLHLSDGSLGLLTGAAFAIFYATLGLPLASYADRRGRKPVIVVCLAIFSAMTALSGLATSFIGLFLARIGVGIGEAGTLPASASILADLYEKEKRSTAMAILSVGGNLGLLGGFVAGGLIAATYGWRAAFFVVGVPGLVLALLLHFTLREPQRSSPAGEDDNQSAANFRESIAFLIRQPSYLWLLVGLASMVGVFTASVSWLPSLLERSFGMATGDVALPLGLSLGIGGIFGTVVIGGFLTDRLARRDIRWISWSVAVGALLIAPALLAMLFAGSGMLAIGLFLIPAIMGAFFQGPSIALIQTIAPPQMRATSAAIAMFVSSLVGIGGAPMLVGYLSDSFAPVAGNESLRQAMFSLPVIALVAAVAYILAASFVPRDIARAEAFGAMDKPQD